MSTAIFATYAVIDCRKEKRSTISYTYVICLYRLYDSTVTQFYHVLSLELKVFSHFNLEQIYLGFFLGL